MLYRKKEKRRVQCQACSWYCQIEPGNVGICGVRKNIGGKLYLLLYGKTTGLAVDPVEKKPLFHFLPGAPVLSFGTYGCNFGCMFCQNAWCSQPPRQFRSLSIKEQDVLIEQILKMCEDWPPQKIVRFAKKNNLPAIAYTYNEPAIFFEYAFDTAKLAHKAGIKNIFVSNGYESDENLKTIRPYLDAINIDLKSINNNFYLRLCKAKLEPVLKNIKKVYNMGIWLELTTLIIPKENDSEEELEELAKFIKGIDASIPWHVTAFSPAYKMLDYKKTPINTLINAYKIGKRAGLNYIYCGNIFDIEKHSTYCPSCGRLLIKRDWNQLVENKLERKGICPFCKAKIKGVWL